ncbi:MAG: transglutaminase-like domain-containing protein [Lachnospiraceae bacterium]|nr:transglutaminase-like domain-containing protein [Lachnospiraceae bacterium]
MKERVRKLSGILAVVMLAVSVLTTINVTSYAENGLTIIEGSLPDRYVKAGTKYYNIPSEKGSVVFTSPTDSMLPVRGICAENGWYVSNVNGAPVFVNPKNVYSNQDAYIAKTVGQKAANKKIAAVLPDGTKLFNIGAASNGMPILSVFPNIKAPAYLIAAIDATGILPTDDEFTKINKVRNYVSSHVSYDKSCHYRFGSTYDTLTMGRAVCAGYAQVTETLLLAVGVDAVCDTGKNASGVAHDWCGVNIGGVRYSFEPQLNSSQSPVVQGDGAGLGYVRTGERRLSTIEKIAPDQKTLSDLTFTKWKK